MNEYYSYSPLTANTVARAADVNTRFSGVEAGFDKLPAPALIAEDRVTYGADVGVVNAYVINPAVPITAYNTGLRVRARAATRNTGPATVDVSGLGVKQIVRVDGTPLIAGDIVADQIIDLTYDGVNFRLAMAFAEMSPSGVATKISQAGALTINGTVDIHVPNLTAGLRLNAPSDDVSIQYVIGGSAVATLVADTGGFAIYPATGKVVSLNGDVNVPTYATATNSALVASTAFVKSTLAGYALLASPAFTGTPTAPTALAGTNTTQLATTAFVTSAVAPKANTASPAFTGTPTAPTAAVDTNTTQLATTAYVVGQGYLKAATATATYAPLASPTFTGTPTAPTPAAGTNTTQLATTAFVTRDFAKLVSPSFTGTPTAPTAASGTNTTQIATTAFVTAAVAGMGGPYAPLDSPAFTGTPTAPTALASTNTTQLATTAFVIGQGNTVAGTIAMNGAQAAGTSLLFAKADHVHPTDTSRAPLASPGLTGTPTAPTAAANTNTTQIATTAFVLGQANSTATNIKMDGAQAAGASLLYARADHVHPTDTSRAPLASPAFTGTPTAPTPATGNNSTLLATTAYVQANLANYVTTGSLAGYAQLAGADFSGAITTASTLGFGNRVGQHINLYSTTYGAGVQSSTLYLRSGGSRLNFYIGGVHSDLQNDPGLNGTIALGLTTTAATFSGSVTATSFSGSLNMGDAASGTLAVARGGTGATTSTGTGSVVLSSSPALAGTPTAPTAAAATNTTQIATTAFVHSQSYAPLASPAFTGTPTVPTAAANTNTTQAASTAFVLGQANGVATNIKMNGAQAAGTSLLYARADHVHPTDTSRAPLASPTFTGVPAAPTAAVGTNNTQIATTAFVHAAGFAPLASPSFTGTPTAPTAAWGTSDTKLATTAFVDRLRSLPTSTTVGRTLAIGDRGAAVMATGTVTVPASVFASGDVVTVYNNSAAGISLAQGASLTLRQSGTANTGNRTIAQRGFATIFFVSATEAVVSGDIS